MLCCACSAIFIAMKVLGAGNANLWFVQLAIILKFGISVNLMADDGVLRFGAGSIRTSRPAHCKPLPGQIFRTPENTGPMVSNQWWSSLVWLPHSQNIFAHPAFYRFVPKGMIMGYQGGHIHGNFHGIFGNADLEKGDFTLSHSNVEEFPDARCKSYSEWFVEAALDFEDNSLHLKFGHGSPYVFGAIAGGDPVVTFNSPPQVWSSPGDGKYIGVTIHGRHYGLFGSAGSTWEAVSKTQFVNRNRSGQHFSLAVLPDDKISTLQFFASRAHNHVADTTASYSIEGNKLNIQYQHHLQSMEDSDSRGTVFALYPHQWKYTETPLTDFTYNSVRGLMKVAEGVHFEMQIPIHGVLPRLPSEGIPDRGRVVGLLSSNLPKEKIPYADTYWEGKYLGSLASLSGVAEAAGAHDMQKLFLDEIRLRLEEWFSATPDKEEPVFYYNNEWGSLIGSRPSYGSDDLLNDHHFHYGYFIRAAAEVARQDPDWARLWGPVVEMLIRDIATTDKSDPMFPHIRCFDTYAGHSWASGGADFGDGNNQESSSESLNAWYGIMLWGAVTGNHQLLDLGTYLFNMERIAVEEYWFDVDNTNYPTDYPGVALGMVWGGKGAFATWFSPDIDCIHGINWLPFTPASLYMGRHPEYVEKNFQHIVRNRQSGPDFNQGWGDLVLMFGALNDTQPAIKHLEAFQNPKIESGNTLAFMDHWIQTLSQLGHVDRNTTSEHIFSTTFKDSKGQKTYSAYNFEAHPITIEFSDGFVLSVPARAYKTDTSK